MGRGQAVSLKLVKESLLDAYIKCWKNEISSKPKLDKYSQLVTKWETSGYLKVSLHKYKRSLISQLLCGVLPLSIETGRYYKLLRCDRLCPLCKTNVECEFHFLFECTATMHKRVEELHKIPELLNYCNNIDKFNFLLKKPYVLGSYVKSLWQEHNSIIVKMTKLVCNNSQQRVGANFAQMQNVLHT